MQIAIDELLLNHASQILGLSPAETAEKGLRLMLTLLNHQELLEELEDIEEIQAMMEDIKHGRETLSSWASVKAKAGL